MRLQLLDQQGRRRAEPLAAEGLVRREIAIQRVMIDDVGWRFRLDASYLRETLGIDQRDLFDLLGSILIMSDEGQGGSVEGEECLDVAVEAIGQHRDRGGIELMGCQQRRQRVEIRIFVTQDDVHKTSSFQTGLL